MIDDWRNPTFDIRARLASRRRLPVLKGRPIRGAAAFALGALLLAPAPATFGGGTPATGAITDQLQTMGGGGAPAGVGDFISSFRVGPPAGIDEAYDYFIEVPPGASALEVDIFDADVLAGAGDITGERDQDRTSSINTKSRYRLFDPAGNEVATRFSYGDDSANNPPSADNAWKLFYDNTTAGISGGDTFVDSFNTNGSYAGDDSSAGVSWSTDWIEANDLGGAGAGSGDVVVTGNELSIDNQSDGGSFTNQPSVEREVDLSGYVAAVFSFDWRTLSGVDRMANSIGDIGDSIAIEVSDDGGTTYTIIDEFGGLVGVQSGSALYDITDYLAANTRIRFRISNRYAGTDETILIDDVQIRAVTTANGGTPDAGHWRLEVDMTGDVNGHVAGTARNTNRQNDVNAFGLRAHDGDASSSGTEYNLYADSFVIVGINDNDRTRTYDFYPYITRGCDYDINNWDWDASNAPINGSTQTSPYGGTIATSPTTAFQDDNLTGGGTMSDNAAWDSRNVSGFTTSDDSNEYGIWDLEVRIDDWGDNNYGPVYLGAHDASAPSPTAQPEANTFRIYFPTDGGSAPAKPYLSQFLRFVPGQSTGDNPPTVGQTSRYAVSVVVTNPSGSIGDIAFSTSPARLVTANIPGGDVLYGGTAFVSQGSVTSEPSIGGSGDIVWNPGTLAPGDEETLVYYVDVSPSSSPLTLDLTGAVGSGDGTSATWLDETEDTTTGVITFGELCELTVTTPAPPPTQALIASFDAVRSGAEVMVEWQTAGEVGSASFDLYRLSGENRVRVNERSLGALIGHPQGGVYRFLDRHAPAGDLRYELVEHETSGRTRTYGPFDVEASSGPISQQATFESAPHPPQAQHFARLERAAEEATQTQPAAGRGAGGALRLEIGETGLYRLSAAEIAAGFGLSELDARRLVARNELRLTTGGEHGLEELTWIKGERGAWLDFVGFAIDTPFTGTNVYRLEMASGSAVQTPRRQLPPPPDWSDGTFTETRHFEESTFGVTLLPLDPESDTWIWDYVRSDAGGFATASFAAAVPSPDLAAGDATLRLEVFGGLEGEHLLAVRWNGVEVGQVSLEDLDALTAELSVPAAALIDGENSLVVESLAGGLVFIDSFELEYERYLHPESDFLLAPAERGQASAAPFVDPAIRVFDISDARAPRPLAVRIVQEASGHRAIWRAGGGTYLAASDAALRAPVVSFDQASDLAGSQHEVDYLVITTADLMSSAEDLAALRAAQGLSTMVVDIQDVYDEFAFGRRDVRAVRSLINHALEHWQRAPSYVVIAGAGTYDHRNYLGLEGNLIPVLQASDGEGLYASDAALADVDGDGAMDVAIGRLPVLSASELDTHVAKIETYEAGGDWLHRLMMVADETDGPTVFAAESSALSALLPAGYEVTSIDLDALPVADARQALFDGIAAGTAWIHYTGHGGVDRWSKDEELLLSSDVGNLVNGGALPVVTSVTCLFGLHALPGYDVLGELLVLDETDGAVAVIAPTWDSEHPDARYLGDRLFRQVFQRQAARLGDALKDALASTAATGAPPGLLRSYQLLGDPALLLQREPVEQEGDLVCLPDQECDG